MEASNNEHHLNLHDQLMFFQISLTTLTIIDSQSYQMIVVVLVLNLKNYAKHNVSFLKEEREKFFSSCI